MVKRTEITVTVKASGTAHTPTSEAFTIDQDGTIVGVNVHTNSMTLTKKGDTWVSTGVAYPDTGLALDQTFFTSGYNYAGNNNSWIGQWPAKVGDKLFLNLVTVNVLGTARANFSFIPNKGRGFLSL